jgi:hypothetical protein
MYVQLTIALLTSAIGNAAINAAGGGRARECVKLFQSLDTSSRDEYLDRIVLRAIEHGHVHVLMALLWDNNAVRNLIYRKHDTTYSYALRLSTGPCIPRTEEFVKRLWQKSQPDIGLCDRLIDLWDDCNLDWCTDHIDAFFWLISEQVSCWWTQIRSEAWSKAQ